MAIFGAGKRTPARRTGRKTRPCVIVIAATVLHDRKRLLVAPVTHSQQAPGDSVRLPPSVKRRLGLDEQASWVMCTELNSFVWPGFDLAPVSRAEPDRFSWGFLPVELVAQIKQAILHQQKIGGLRIVVRD